MTLGTEKRAVQRPFVKYATEAGWTYLSPDDALALLTILPATGLSSTDGCVLVPHCVGLAALQVLPIVALVIVNVGQWVHWSNKTSRQNDKIAQLERGMDDLRSIVLSLPSGK